VFTELVQSAPTNLYFVDIRKLMEEYHLEYVSQQGDDTGPGTVLGGCAGTIESEQHEQEKVVSFGVPENLRLRRHALSGGRKGSIAYSRDI